MNKHAVRYYIMLGFIWILCIISAVVVFLAQNKAVQLAIIIVSITLVVHALKPVYSKKFRNRMDLE